MTMPYKILDRIDAPELEEIPCRALGLRRSFAP